MGKPACCWVSFAGCPNVTGFACCELSLADEPNEKVFASSFVSFVDCPNIREPVEPNEKGFAGSFVSLVDCPNMRELVCGWVSFAGCANVEAPALVFVAGIPNVKVLPCCCVE